MKSPVVFACDMAALSRAERERHHALVEKLVASRLDQRELENGLQFTIGREMTAAEVAEWVSMEIRCCPFVSFSVQLETGEPSIATLTGPEGVTPFLIAELGLS